MRAIKSNRSNSGAFVDVTANVLARAIVNSFNSGATVRPRSKPPRLRDRVKELQLLEAEMEIPKHNTYGGHRMDALDRKIVVSNQMYDCLKMGKYNVQIPFPSIDTTSGVSLSYVV